MLAGGDGPHPHQQRPIHHRAARSRAEDGWFRDCVQTHTPAARHPGPRLGDPDEVYTTTPAPLPSAEGYRIVWIHSSAKTVRDAAARTARIDAGVAALEGLDAKLAGPRCRLKTRPAVEAAARDALAGAHADRWVAATITETVHKTYKQERRGRPGPATRYKEIATTRYTVRADLLLDHIGYDAATDGCFPLITNDRDLSDAHVLAAYRYQPNLERRHHLLESVQHAAPVLLKTATRIEAFFCCQFLALLVAALIERQVRTGMARAALKKIPLYPEFRGCPAPFTERILEIFAAVSRHYLYDHDTLVQTFEPELTTQQLQVLDLLDLPSSAYTRTP